MTPQDWRHGTTSGYNAGCRDRCCREPAVAKRRQDRARARQRGLAPDDDRHGTINGYTNYSCSCPRCKAAGIAAHDRWLASRTA